jgi:hypothetical protein
MADLVYYDPDYRKDPPKNGHYCERCQKPIKDINKAVKVETNWDYPEGTIEWGFCRESETGKRFIGADCWKIITNNK